MSFKEIQTRKSEDVRGHFSTEELVNVFKKLSTRPEIYHLLVRFILFDLYTKEFSFFLKDILEVMIFFQHKI